jgi:hypothetical protein
MYLYNNSSRNMCLMVVINLVANKPDKQGKDKPEDRIDHRCRWVFPLVFLDSI